ncbi:MAG: porin family protein [Pedobacter sp.]|uniref:porin family protein n=1 Tax=Pedobacter sp. TaxID=1411316 RepID=UPI003393B2E1
MKKIFILAIGLFVATAASAQDRIKFGIKGGLNYSDIIERNGNNNFDTEAKAGFNAGVTLEIPLIAGLQFTPEVLYAQKGYKNTYSYGTFKQTTNFIDVPILFAFRLGSSFNIVAGPQVSFLLSTKNKFENGFGTVEETYVEDDSDRFKKSLVGGVIGFRYDVNDKFDIHARYAIDFQKNNEDGTQYTPEYRNQVYSVGVGIKF